METRRRLLASFDHADLLQVEAWPQIKSAYIELINPRFDDELSETWYNSIFCGLFSHDCISDGTMFIHTTRPAVRAHERLAQTRRYRPNGDLRGMLEQILRDYAFSVPYCDLPGDLQQLQTQLCETLPDWVCKDPELTVEVFVSVLYRNKGAYLIGRIFTCDEQWPLAIPLLHRDGQGIVADALITDEAEVSIIFSFTRSYFAVEVPILPSSSAFSSASCPASTSPSCTARSASTSMASPSSTAH